MRLEIEKPQERNTFTMDLRINAASRELGLSYSKFINNLSNKNIALDRKTLSQIAVEDPSTFKKIVEITN